MKCSAKIFLAIALLFAQAIYAADYDYIELNPFTGNLDATRSNTGIAKTFLKLDTSNDPLTGDLDFGTIDLYADSPLKLYVNNQLAHTWEVSGDNFIFEDGNNFTFEDGNNFIFN